MSGHTTFLVFNLFFQIVTGAKKATQSLSYEMNFLNPLEIVKKINYCGGLFFFSIGEDCYSVKKKKDFFFTIIKVKSTLCFHFDV